MCNYLLGPMKYPVDSSDLMPSSPFLLSSYLHFRICMGLLIQVWRLSACTLDWTRKQNQ